VVSSASAGSVVIQVSSGFLERSTVSPRERQLFRSHFEFPLICAISPKPAEEVLGNSVRVVSFELGHRVLREPNLIGFLGVAFSFSECGVAEDRHDLLRRCTFRSHRGLPRPMEPEQPCIAVTALGEGVVFSRDERERHIYVVGKTGTGKSTFLFNLAMGDIEAEEGVAVIDPHGDLAEAVADCIPPHRTNHVCYLDVSDTTRPVGFNPLAGVPAERRALAASGIVSAFKHLWRDSWGPRLEHFLFHGVMTLLEGTRSTLIDLPRLYTNADFRERVLSRVSDPITRRFWREEFAEYDKRFLAEAIAPLLNKAGQFATSPNVRGILGQVTPKFDLAHAMNNRQILIANLSKGQIGEQASNLLGLLLISHLHVLTMHRSRVPRSERVPFFVVVDEFQSFGTDAFASLFSEARKYGTFLCCATQFSSALSATARAAVLGNAGSLIVFRVSASDAELLAPELHPVPATELIDQMPFRAHLRRASQYG
jgi:Type IV secretion-system coupling protein DNA-binding domain